LRSIHILIGMAICGTSDCNIILILGFQYHHVRIFFGRCLLFVEKKYLGLSCIDMMKRWFPCQIIWLIFPEFYFAAMRYKSFERNSRLNNITEQ